MEKGQCRGRARGKTTAGFGSSDSSSFVVVKDACREEPFLSNSLLVSGPSLAGHNEVNWVLQKETLIHPDVPAPSVL